MKMKTRTIFCAVLISLSFLPALGTSQHAEETLRALGQGRHAAQPETLLVSVNSVSTGSGNRGGGSIDIFGRRGKAVSSDGRFMAFQSNSSDLVDNGTNGVDNIFVRDLKTGTTTLVSANSAGTACGNDGSLSPAISADGRLVAFRSFASD